MTEMTSIKARLASFRPESWSLKTLALSALKCAKRGFVNSGTDQIECALCHLPIKLPGIFTDRQTEEQSLILAKFKHEMRKAHKEGCPFGAMEEKQKLVLREKPPLYEYQTDYMDFTRASFYLNWEVNFHANRDSFSAEKTIIPLIDSEWVEKTLKAEVLELLWLNGAVERKAKEFDAVNVIALYGWKHEVFKEVSTLICKYCLRRTCASIYTPGTAIQTIEKIDIGKTFLFNPEKAHYMYCKWVRQSQKYDHKNGPELSLELLRARLDLATQSVNTSRILSKAYANPQDYVEEKLKVATQIKQIYAENKLLASTEPFTLKKTALNLKDVDTLESGKLIRFIEKKLKEALDRNKAIHDKTEQIKLIVAGKRKEAEEILAVEQKNKKAKADEELRLVPSDAQV